MRDGAAASSTLRMGDRILEVNDNDLRYATHQDGVDALLSSGRSMRLFVRHDPPPPDMTVTMCFSYELVLVRFFSAALRVEKSSEEIVSVT